jgi:hypothetical protein
MHATAVRMSGTSGWLGTCTIQNCGTGHAMRRAVSQVLSTGACLTVGYRLLVKLIGMIHQHTLQSELAA